MAIHIHRPARERALAHSTIIGRHPESHPRHPRLAACGHGLRRARRLAPPPRAGAASWTPTAGERGSRLRPLDPRVQARHHEALTRWNERPRIRSFTAAPAAPPHPQPRDHARGGDRNAGAFRARPCRSATWNPTPGRHDSKRNRSPERPRRSRAPRLAYSPAVSKTRSGNSEPRPVLRRRISARLCPSTQSRRAGGRWVR